MNNLIIAILIITAGACFAAPPSIGAIIDSDNVNPPKTVNVEYSYTKENELILTFRGIAMNAAAKGVTGKVKVNGGSIKIWVHEIYDAGGPFDSLKTYTIRYTIKNVPKMSYIIEHNDVYAEGVDRLVTVHLDLNKSANGKIEVEPQEYYRVDLTPDDPWDNKEEIRLTPLKKSAEQVAAPDS
ncbi:hypothetical protein HW115_19515 [Verrucomicrobiaceae bacterium N1E253]|uniref:Uncharacterized protein n=1 Tax=Oceaniferula marina TaxID=2748318 RepID=A0A851GS05_9BACT|nr:hypothetical protein [Oceaniferula marina]NWK57817.1 hypothetical protein [Oceaniferula marina]